MLAQTFQRRMLAQTFQRRMLAQTFQRRMLAQTFQRRMLAQTFQRRMLAQTFQRRMLARRTPRKVPRRKAQQAQRSNPDATVGHYVREMASSSDSALDSGRRGIQPVSKGKATGQLTTKACSTSCSQEAPSQKGSC